MKTIFVSSTFSDMQIERDALRDITSAKVNAEAREYGDHIEFCDLRWGISTEDMESESASLKVLDVCLDEIDRSNPPIIILLGDRYGWIPDAQLVQSIAQRRKLALEDLRMSATALEAEYGAIAQGRTAFVYIREIVSPEQEVPSVFMREDELRSSLVKSLKSRLTALPNCHVKNYKLAFENGKPNKSDIEAFADMVSNDLIANLKGDWKRFEAMTPFERERERQWAFIRDKNAMFSARESDASRLIEMIGQSQTTLCRGTSGSGKSTLCSHIALWARDHEYDVLPFIGGLTDESNDAMDVLRNTVYFLEDSLGMPHFSTVTAQSLKENSHENIPTLKEWQDRLLLLGSKHAETGKKLLVVVDAVDQLFPDEVREKCGFIPKNLSSSIQFFLTALPDTVLNIKDVYVLQPLTRDDKKKVVDGILKKHGKELAPRVIEHLLDLAGSSNPHYISLATQRLQMMAASDFESINERACQEGWNESLGAFQIEILDNCPEDINEMCVDVFTEAGKRIDAWFATEVLNCLAVTRYGLRRSDLASLLGDDWNELKFSHLLNYLQEDFQFRSDGRIDFMHKSAREGLRKRLSGDSSYDIKIVNHLETLHPHDPLRMDEILYHTAHADDRERFEKYIKSYELGEDADPEIITRAAACMRYLCLSEGTSWIEGLLENAAYSNRWASVYWFALKELCESYGPVLEEQKCNKATILKVDEQLEKLKAEGRMTEKNNRAFAKRLLKSIRPVLDFNWLVGGTGHFDRIVENYLGQAKADYDASDGDTSKRWELFHAYFNIVHVYKATARAKATRDGMTLAGGAIKMTFGQSRNSSEYEDRYRKGITIGEEGLALLDDSLMSYDQKRKDSIAPTYYQYLGDLYKYLDSFEKSLEMYQSSLELLIRSNSGNVPSTSLFELGNAFALVGSAYYELRDRAQSSENYTKALSLFEIAMTIGGIDDSQLRTVADAYWLSCWIYFANPKDPRSGTDLANQSLLWGYKSCDLLRRHYRATGDTDDKVCWTENSTFILRTIPIDPTIADEVVSSLKAWVAEDENRYLLDPVHNAGSFIITCNFVAQVLLNSKLKNYYDLVISCCDKGIAAAKTSSLHASAVREDISKFQGIKSAICMMLDPNNEQPLIDRVNVEIELEEQYGELSAQLGNAYFNLASFYYSNEAKRDVDAFMKWNRKAAECGNVRAQLNMGHIYREGRNGVEKNLNTALIWYRKAADQGSDEGKRLCDRLFLEMCDSLGF